MIAAEVGCTPGTVTAQRQKRGIPSYTESQQREVDWDVQPLGVDSDERIAERLGVAVHRVRLMRQARGIPSINSKKLVDWDAQPLGEMKDAVLAERLDRSTRTVAEQRAKRGIPSWSERIAPASGWWDDKGLGQRPDRWVATDLGVHATTVRAARSHRGIPVFSGGIRTQEGFACHSQIEARYDAYLHWQGIDHQHQVAIPDTRYIADFWIDGTFVEVVGMLEYQRYAEKLERKVQNCQSLGHAIRCVSPEEVEQLAQGCPVSIKFTPERACISCGEFARNRHFCSGCQQKSFTKPKMLRYCKYQAVCKHCSSEFGFNGNVTRTYCSNACQFAARAGIKGTTDWDAVGLGTRPDAEIAEKLGYAYVTVSAQRRRRGIPAFKTSIDWDTVVFDRPDAELAQELGCTVQTVQSRRQKRTADERGRKRPNRRNSFWTDVDWARPDEELAMAYGYEVSTVKRKRQDLAREARRNADD